MMVIHGSPDDPEFLVVGAPAPDQWDDWSDQRDAYLLRAQSPRYVSQDIYGTEDLDRYGRWSNDPAYGDVWTPAVPASWAPYRDGRWVWEDYYGWTWVDASPWGWAPFHYGSWYYRTNFGWSWFPGHRYEHCWYRPALVGFFGFGGGSGFGFGRGFGNIGWIPLAPYERFHPWYGRGGWGARNGGFTNINIVRNTNITNIYQNSRFGNGVTAVSGSDFQRGNFRNRVGVDGSHLQGAALVRGAVPFTPGGDHLRFSDRTVPVAGPRINAGNQRFFSRTPGGQGFGSQRVPFSQQQSAVRSTVEGRGFGNGVSGNGGSGNVNGSAPGWQRFGNPQPSPQRSTNYPGSSGGAPSGGAMEGRRFGAQSPRSLQIAPPLVRERQFAPQNNAPQNNAPNYNRGFYSGGNGNNRPMYRQPGGNSAPRVQPGNGGGGGGFGSPGFRGGGGGQSRPAPSAPSYRPAPAPQNHGGGGGGGNMRGGGGGNGGGGHMGGGGGGNSGGQRGRR
jgi:hypothetical protein